MRTGGNAAILVLGALTLVRACLGQVGQCYDADGLCADPCPCENACFVHEDCAEGLVCLPGCLAPVKSK